MALLRSALVLAFIASLLVASMGRAQGPWTVKVYSTMNPLPIGVCAAVRVEIVDPETRDVPRRPTGERVTIADFDMVVASPAEGSVAPQWVDAYHFSACGCQSGTAGSSATVSARYPAAALPERARVPGVSFQVKGEFSLGKAQNGSDPVSCTNPSPTPIAITLSTAPVPGAKLPLPAPPAPIAPTPVNPTGFAAAQVGPGKVRLSWHPVKGASYYVLTGPGLPAGGTRVDTTRSGSGLAGILESRDGVLVGSSSTGTVAPQVDFIATPVEAGYREWAVASYYDPGPVSTIADAFPRVALNVVPPVAVNPSGFTGVQTGSGQVRFSWQPVAGASSYILMGPGLPAGGTTVVDARASGATANGLGSNEALAPAVAFTATTIPAGFGLWRVGSYFGPALVSTPVGAFAVVALDVTPPINPSGFAAVQTGSGQVRFSWEPVSGAAYYLLMGPGLPAGGVKVNAGGGGVSSASSGSTSTVAAAPPQVAFTATTIPAGFGLWRVGSHFGPAPVSTPVESFAVVAIVVTPPINPSGFAAVQTGSGQVRFSWEAVSGASYYLLLGPGLPPGGVRVDAGVAGGSSTSSGSTTIGTAAPPQVAFTATTIPTGSGLWRVGSFFGPGALATPVHDFSKVILNVI